MSFTPRSRLIIDSTRSPQGATTATMRPNTNAVLTRQGWIWLVMPADAPIATAQPPTRPSQVLFGLTDGARLCRPKRLPTT